MKVKKLITFVLDTKEYFHVSNCSKEHGNIIKWSMKINRINMLVYVYDLPKIKSKGTTINHLRTISKILENNYLIKKFSYILAT